jgi:hypothetical protein
LSIWINGQRDDTQADLSGYPPINQVDLITEIWQGNGISGHVCMDELAIDDSWIGPIFPYGTVPKYIYLPVILNTN